MKVRDLVISTIIIAIVVSSISWCRYDKQVSQLKAAGDSAVVWSDSIKADADTRVAAADARTAAAEDTVAKLRAASNIVERRAERAQVMADSAASRLTQAKTAADSVPILIVERNNLRTANLNLTIDVALAKAEARTNLTRAIGAEADVHRLGEQITGLNNQTKSLNEKIQALNPPPKLVFRVFEWTTRALAVKGLVDIARGH